MLEHRTSLLAIALITTIILAGCAGTAPTADAPSAETPTTTTELQHQDRTTAERVVTTYATAFINGDVPTRQSLQTNTSHVHLSNATLNMTLQEVSAINTTQYHSLTGIELGDTTNTTLVSAVIYDNASDERYVYTYQLQNRSGEPQIRSMHRAGTVS